MRRRLLIRKVLHEGRQTDILIEEGRFLAFGVAPSAEADEVFDAGGMAILPAFYNTHTHAAMTLLRGYADDMPLQAWLRDHIWPYEEKLTAADISEGSRLAVREMLSTGTVFFNDMYFGIGRTFAEAEAAGMRCTVGVTFIDGHTPEERAFKERFLGAWTGTSSGRTALAVAPHAIYTAGRELLVHCARLAREHGLKLHIHLSETRQEVEDCLRLHGCRPVHYLDSLGFLGPDVVAAHCVHLDRGEWDILAARGVTVSHCPCSNMKLSSGLFPYAEAIASGVRMTLGTDGASSNNNLDMREEMKFAALLAKLSDSPSTLPAEEVFRWATRNGAEAFGLDAGVIAPGKRADAVLLDLSDTKLRPCHNLLSNWVYSADSRCVAAVLCDGKVVYRR